MYQINRFAICIFCYQPLIQQGSQQNIHHGFFCTCHRDHLVSSYVTPFASMRQDFLFLRSRRNQYDLLFVAKTAQNRFFCFSSLSPIDLNYEKYYQWLDIATDARDRFLAGEITEEESLQIIHVPTIRELRENNSVDYTLDYSCPQS